MPVPPPDSVPSDPLPARADVVVIGGGIVGTGAILALAEKGISAVLCEKGRIAGEQSGRNWGWARVAQRDPREIPLMMEALRMWDGMDARTGEETGFRRHGVFYLADTEAELEGKARWMRHAEPYQLNVKLIDGKEVARLIPEMTRKVAGGIWAPVDGKAEPQKAAPAMARAARRLGAAIVTECAVRGIERTGGRISGVVTEKGRIACDAVILAAGAWSRLFAGNAGIDIPQLTVMSSVMRTAPIEGGPKSQVSSGDYGIRKRLDGGYSIARRGTSIADIMPDSFRQLWRFRHTIKAERKERKLRFGKAFFDALSTPRKWSLDAVTPFERRRVLDPDPYMGGLNELKAIVERDFPGMKGMQMADAWGGVIDVTPDVVPVISPVDGTPGLIVATGFSGHGFGIGPAAGRLAADLATGAAPIVDPRPLRLSRYFDGSDPRPQ